LLQLHQRRTAFGIAEDKKFGGPQRQTDCSCASRVIDTGENCQALGLGGGFESIDRDFNAVPARNRRQSVVSHRHPSCSRSPEGQADLIPIRSTATRFAGARRLDGARQIIAVTCFRRTRD
jgi:hypothetical protein